MDNKDKTIILVIIALITMFCCVVVSCCAVGAFALSHADRSTGVMLQQGAGTQKEGSAVGSEGAGTDTQTETIEMGSPDGLSDDEQKIIEATEKVRGLHSDIRFAPIYQSEEELREYMISQVEEITDEEFADELGLYNILGLVPADFDLRQYYIDMYSEQIAGFYDPETNNMYLINDISPYENALTLAHEYTHFLQYNTSDFDQALHYDDDFCVDNPETCLVINALVEGDASLTESLIDPDEILGHHEESYYADSSVYDSSPKYFQDNLVFPYVYGFDFVAYYYLRGGYDAVNELYLELPQSIEQVMHPEKYLIDVPVEVSLEPFKSIISEEFDIKADTVLNEADILMLLNSGYDPAWRLSTEQAQIGSAGWGGGSYIFGTKDGQSIFFTKVVWDSLQDAEEAETVFEIYSNKRFGEQTGEKVWNGENGGSVHLIRQDDILYWMILPDNFNAASILDILENTSLL